MIIDERSVVSQGLPFSFEEPKSLIIELIMGKLPSFSQLFNINILKSFFWSPDPAWLKEGRDDIQKIFNQIIKNEPPHNENVEILTTRLMSIIPYLDPSPGEEITIPFFEKGSAVGVVYKAEEIKITNYPFTSPLIAYGLTPKNQSHPSFLLFKGTTFPGDSGFLLSLLADSTPFHSVGSWVIEHPTTALTQFMDKSSEIVAVGQSLGGALAQHLARLYPEKVKRAVSINGPKLMSYDLEKEVSHPPRIIRYDNQGDLVSKVGNKLLQNTSSYTLEEPKPGYGPFLAHIRAYEVEGVKVFEEKPADTVKGKAFIIMTLLHQIVAPLIFVILAIVLALFMIVRAIIQLGFFLAAWLQCSHREQGQPEDRQKDVENKR